MWKLPEKDRFWALFDLSPGNKISKKHVLLFISRQAARDYKKQQKPLKHSVLLSKPIKVKFKYEHR